MKKIIILLAAVIFLLIPQAKAMAVRYIPTPQQLQPAPQDSQPNFSGNVNFQAENPANAVIDSLPAAGPNNNQSASGSQQTGALPEAAGQKNTNIWVWPAGLLVIVLVVGLFWWITKKPEDL